MSKVVIVQKVLPHYRQSFFELLTQSDDLEIHIIAGENRTNLKSFEPTLSKISNKLVNKKIKIRNHTFFYQVGLIRFLYRKKPDHIVFGGPDFHIVSSLLAALIMKWFTNSKIHWWTHGLHQTNKWINRLQVAILSRSSSAMTYEESGKNQIISGLAWPESKVTVLKNAIRTEDYGFDKPGNEMGKNEQFRILFAGRLTKAKRCDLLIEAAAILAEKQFDFKVTIVGDGTELKYCKRLVDSLDVARNISFCGELYEKEVETIFKNSDLFVLPGKVGLSIIHALSYGLPVITTSNPVHSPEIAVLEDGVNGDYYQGFSVQSLVETILRWQKYLTDSPQEIKRKAKESVKESGYLPENMADKFVCHIKQFSN